MRRALLLAPLALVAGAGVLLSGQDQETFPHARHQGLFPTCAGCHAGIAAGDSLEFVSAEPALCAACHDGTNAPAVSWTGPAERPANNLKTVHPGHPEIPCGACHQTPGTSGEMEVQAAVAENCITCHAPGADEHQAAGVRCTQCHLALTEAPEMSAATISAFSRPLDHASEAFLLEHGSAADADVVRCSVCHARESCTRCHRSADAVAAIQVLEPDARVAALAAAAPGRWPVPPSHRAADWVLTHGAEARESVTSCSTCHTRDTCGACHLDTADEVASDLSVGDPGSAGTESTQSAVPGHTPTFAVAHGEAAVAALPKCSACHAETYCIDCHDNAGRPYFHPVDFVQRHGAEAWAQPMECAECHSREVFCRDCHQTLGADQAGNVNGGYHDGDPNWLLSHGEAARQGMESCTTCHQQSSCLRCHSAKQGWRVNPHGPDFDPEQVREKSEISCGICHFGFQIEP